MKETHFKVAIVGYGVVGKAMHTLFPNALSLCPVLQAIVVLPESILVPKNTIKGIAFLLSLTLGNINCFKFIGYSYKSSSAKRG